MDYNGVDVDQLVQNLLLNRIMELVVSINKNGYKEVTCKEGHWITSYQDGDDILEFSAFKVLYTGVDTPLDGYHCIDDETYAGLVSRQDAELVARKDAKTVLLEKGEGIDLL